MPSERHFGEPAAGSPGTTGSTNARFCVGLADRFAELGVCSAVICPGSRSTPLAVALLRHPAIATTVVLDERSAAFIAVGIGRQGGAPALVVTTSGTATAELHPAVVEADLAAIPLIVCTADRPPELQGVWAPQTIDQTGLFGRCLRTFLNPGPPDPAHEQYWPQIAELAYSAATGDLPGPVQVNLAFREPLWESLDGDPPSPDATGTPDSSTSPGRAKDIPGWTLLDEQLANLIPAIDGRRGVLVAGERAVRDEGDLDAVLGLARGLGWPILADHLSGVRGADPLVIDVYDPLLRIPSVAEELAPEAVIRIGGLLSSKVTNSWLSNSRAAQFGLDRFGICPDPDRVLGSQFRADVGEACASITNLLSGRVPQGWVQRWRELAAGARSALDAGLDGEPALLAHMTAAAPPGAAVVVSSSMPVRDLEWFVRGRQDLSFHSNRGANGIDGVVSTAVGVALGGQRTLCVVGDIAMLHDSNALIGLADRDAHIYLLVIDNDGGGIFSFLPQASQIPAPEFEMLFGTPHGTDLAALARVHGLDAAPVLLDSIADDVRDWGTTGGVRVRVFQSSRPGNVVVHQQAYDAVRSAVEGTL